jgi:hypothetical protein
MGKMELKYSDALNIFEAINSSCLKTLVDPLIKSAIRYANIRAEWKFLNTTERAEKDLERTAAHNCFIDACNILSRNQAANGENCEWRKKLSNDRKTIGDLACYIHLFIGIAQR